MSSSPISIVLMGITSTELEAADGGYMPKNCPFIVTIRKLPTSADWIVLGTSVERT